MGRTGPRVGAVEPLTPDRLLADAMLHPGQPVIISDWQAETRLRLPLALREAGVASSVATVISIGRGERAYGFLGAHSREPRTFSDEDILFLETAERFLACSFAGGQRAVVSRAHRRSSASARNETSNSGVWGSDPDQLSRRTSG